MTKLNRIQDFQDNPLATIQATGFLIMDDFWLTKHTKAVFCLETNKTYKVIDFQYLILDVLKPEHRRVPGWALRNGGSNWETRKLSCIRTENQDELKPGFRLQEYFL